MDLQAKNVIVTGGARGLGLSLVKKLLTRGSRVGVFDLNQGCLQQLHDAHPELECFTCDVTDRVQVATAVDDFCKKAGPVHALVNNAGLLYNEPLIRISPSGLQQHSPEMWEKVIAANLTSVFTMTSCIAGRMVMTRTKGVIINISSISACGNAGQTAYSAAKAGVNAMTAVWAKELGPMGIRVAAVAPGFTDTESTCEVMSESNLDDIKRRVPLRRLGRPEEIADGIIAMIENDFFNGKVLQLDGGLVL